MAAHRPCVSLLKQPACLPAHLQAYRDWCVEIFDWQSQSSMLADAEGLTATNRRMMPTVGAPEPEA